MPSFGAISELPISALPSGNTPTNITLVSKSWKWNGTAVGLRVVQHFTLVSRSWKWVGTALSANAKTVVGLVSQSWVWLGRAINVNTGTIATRLLMLLRVGS